MVSDCLCDLIKEYEPTIIDICNKYADKPGSLITILNDVQDVIGFLPIQVQEVIARATGISLSEIYGVATFYSRFNLEPTGKHKISVCLGTACYVKGSQALLDGFKRALDVEVGETTSDNMFTLEATRCIGACGLAPVVTVDEEVYGNSKPEDVSRIIRDFYEEEV